MKTFQEILLNWMEVQEGKKTKKDLRHSTILFTDTMKKHGADPDAVFSAELQDDPELRKWFKRKLKGKRKQIDFS